MIIIEIIFSVFLGAFPKYHNYSVYLIQLTVKTN